MSNFVIIEEGAEWPWTLAETEQAANEKLAALKAEHPTQWATGRIVSYEVFQAEHDARYLNAPVREITAEEFDEMLGVLPPLQWHTTPDGVNVFCISEFTSGRITAQYGRRNNAYRARYVSYGDRSTYLCADDFS